MQSNSTIKVQLRLAEDNNYYLVDLDPNSIEVGDIVTEVSSNNWAYRLTEIESAKEIDSLVHRRVITNQDSIGIRTIDNSIIKIDFDVIKRLSGNKAIMFMETENDDSPILENELYVCSYLYSPAETATRNLKEELDYWQKHKASSWLGKWYKQVRIDKIKSKLDKLIYV